MHNLAVLAASAKGKPALTMPRPAHWFKQAASYGLWKASSISASSMSVGWVWPATWSRLIAGSRSPRGRAMRKPGQKRDEVAQASRAGRAPDCRPARRRLDPKPRLAGVNRLAPETPAGWTPSRSPARGRNDQRRRREGGMEAGAPAPKPAGRRPW